MQNRIDQLMAEVEAAALDSAEAAEAFRLQYLARKGAIPALFGDFKTVPNDAKKAVGLALNALKDAAEAKLAAAQERFKAASALHQPDDLTRPGLPVATGGRHPLALVLNRILDALAPLGFVVADGPEAETDWHNFGALNFEADHPARDMQDTFFLAHRPDVLLRTHTSNVQVRAMEAHKPPIRILAPGRVYRNEAVSARAHCFFHQVEGLAVDEGLSLADLRQTLGHLARTLFGPETRVRLRASYFPFTEISAEIDISCLICQGAGCTVCKGTGWVEILGAGMVDPAVLANCGIDPDRYSGYAFGMGVERIAQLLYRVPDLRLYSQNDLRFLQPFGQLGV